MRRKEFAKRITAIVLAATTMLSVAGTNTLTAQAADVNQDGNVDVYDLQRLYEHVSGIRLLSAA